MRSLSRGWKCQGIEDRKYQETEERKCRGIEDWKCQGPEGVREME